jgi:hypothetical protein
MLTKPMKNKIVAFIMLLTFGLVVMFIFAGSWTEYQVKKIYKARQTHSYSDHKYVVPPEKTLPKTGKNINRWYI